MNLYVLNTRRQALIWNFKTEVIRNQIQAKFIFHVALGSHLVILIFCLHNLFICSIKMFVYNET